MAASSTEDRRLYTLVRGWGIFNRLYGDFYTGADSCGQQANGT